MPRLELRLIAIACATALVVAATAASAQDARSISIVSHRGLLLDAPENTLANFTACLQLRLGFEFDVRRCASGELVCVHDDTVDRTTDGHGRVGELTLAQLGKLDAGSWFSAEYRDQRIPTIDAVLGLIAAYQVAGLYTVDLKADDAEVEADVVRLATKHGVLQRLLFIGRAIDHPEVRSRLKAADKSCHIAALANRSEDLAAALADADADWVYLRFVPTAAEVQAIRNAGKKSFVAGAKFAGRETANWRQAAAAGVDGILTDYALECRRELQSRK